MDASSSSVAGVCQCSYLPGKLRHQKPAKAPLSTMEALEVHMDKMSTWQLMQGLERDRSLNTKNMNRKVASTSKADDVRNWIQIFTEDVVEKQCVYYCLESSSPHEIQVSIVPARTMRSLPQKGFPHIHHRYLR